VLLARLVAEHTTFPASTFDPTEERNWQRTMMPPDLEKFYHRTNGAELFGSGQPAAFRILPREQLEPLNWANLVFAQCSSITARPAHHPINNWSAAERRRSSLAEWRR
jgi:hypothetical protein